MASNKSEKKIQPTNPAAAAEPAKTDSAEASDRKTASAHFGRKSSRKTSMHR